MVAPLYTLVLALTLSQPQVTPDGPRCMPATYADLQEVMAQEPTVCIVVFATWCAPCRQHLLEADTKAIIVGAFDDDDHINGAVLGLGLGQRCWLDRGITRALGIKSVPASRCFTRRPTPPQTFSDPEATSGVRWR